MKTKKIILFGAGNRLGEILDDIAADVEVLAVADNDCLKWGEKKFGIEVISPDRIKEYAFEYIFIIPYSFNTIRKQLREIGIANEKIIDETHMEFVCTKQPISHYIVKQTVDRNAILFTHALTSSGAQNVLFTLAKELDEIGYQVTVISPKDGPLRSRMNECGINVVILRDIYVHINEIKDFIRDAAFVLINTLWLHYIVDAIYKYKEGIIWWIHESIDIEYIDEQIFGKLQKSNGKIMAVSELIRDEIIEKINIDINVDVFRFCIPKYNIRKVHNEKIKFVMIAAMDYIKGQDVFINAVNLLPPKVRQRADFSLVGGGRRSQILLESAELSGVEIQDEVPPEEICKIYADNNVVVCASRKEAMSVTIAEAWMNGLISIVSDAAGISRYVTDYKDGLVFESDNPKALSNKILWIINNYDSALNIAEQSRLLYDKYFSLKVFRKKIMEICEG